MGSKPHDSASWNGEIFEYLNQPSFMNPSPSPGSTGKRDDKLPPVGEVVIVQCDGFRCMAFRDPQGKWRDYFHRDELRGRIEVLSKVG